MGIPGIWKEIGKGERIALSKLSVEHLERTQRPLRIAIDAAIWSFQNQAGQGGKNPALRTLFYRLLRFLALPIHPIFVYDGKNRPRTKRGKTVSRYGTCIPNETSKKLVEAFRFPFHTAPGEAEAECAFLQQKGVVDAVMSQDADTIAFGSGLTLRDWSKEGTRGNKCPTHVNALDLSTVKSTTGLDPDGMILVALLSGGDYDESGVPGFGPALACDIARAGFGTDLLDLVRRGDEKGLNEWRERLNYELETNESGYFKKKHKLLKLCQDFPNRDILRLYTNPIVSTEGDLKSLEKMWKDMWNSNIDVPALRTYTRETFEWSYKSGAWKFVRNLAPVLLANKLWRSESQNHIVDVEQILERRQYFINDGIPELRVLVTPEQIVGLDLGAEEDDPAYIQGLREEQDSQEGEASNENVNGVEDDAKIVTSSQLTQRKTTPWQPDVPEKIWIAETIVQLGAPAIVEEWQQLQRDILADPKRFATRKAVKSKGRGASADPEAGSLHKYFRSPQVESRTNGSAFTGSRMHHSHAEQPKSNSRITLAALAIIPESESSKDGLTNMKTFFRSDKVMGGTNANKTRDEIGLRPECVDSIAVKQKKSSTAMIVERSKDLSSTRSFSGSNIPLTQKSVDGTSFENAVLIMSSPPASHTEPTQAQHSSNDSDKMISSIPSTPSRTDELPCLPISVTERKKHRNKKMQLNKSSVQENDTQPKSSNIQTIFSPLKHKISTRQAPNDASKKSEARINEPKGNCLIQPRMSALAPKLSVMSRDSLPGTWKMTDSDILCDAPVLGTGSKINYVDLTGS